MPRYFMNIRTGSGERIEDQEGDDLPDLEASRAEALASAADLMSKSIGLDWRDCAFEITNERGETEFILPFSQAPQPRRI